MQGWEFAHLLFRSKSLSLKSDKEQFALVALKKEQSWANRSCRYLQKSDESKLLSTLFKQNDESDLLVIRSFALKKRAICSNKFVVLTMFLKWLPLLHFYKKRPWVNCSRRYLQKSDSLLEKSDSLLEKNELLLCSFTHKKWAIQLKNRRAKSQPWFYAISYELAPGREGRGSRAGRKGERRGNRAGRRGGGRATEAGGGGEQGGQKGGGKQKVDGFARRGWDAWER